jgi:hypothetical protein
MFDSIVATQFKMKNYKYVSVMTTQSPEDRSASIARNVSSGTGPVSGNGQ